MKPTLGITDNVINLAERKQAADMKAASQKLNADGGHYFCVKCDNDRFKLFVGGAVHCVTCGAMMSNLTVEGST